MTKSLPLKPSDIMIRTFQEEDIEPLNALLKAQNWHPRTEVYQRRYEFQTQGLLQGFVALIHGYIAGHLFYYPTYDIGVHVDVPYVEDLLVFEPFQNQHVASHLMDVAEQHASMIHPMLVLAVGLHEGYGKAQSFYAKRGYVPDGTGSWYKNQKATPYGMVKNDDEFVLILTKKWR